MTDVDEIQARSIESEQDAREIIQQLSQLVDSKEKEIEELKKSTESAEEFKTELIGISEELSEATNHVGRQLDAFDEYVCIDYRVLASLKADAKEQMFLADYILGEAKEYMYTLYTED